MSETHGELARVRRKLKAVVDEAARNEAILRRAQQRELALLRSHSLQDLIVNLVDGLRESFGLDTVTLAIADPDHEVHHLLLFHEPQAGPPPGVMLVEDLVSLSPTYSKLSQAWLGPYSAVGHGALFPPERVPRSVALLPLYRDRTMVGCLNLGSGDARRFTRHHAADFLNHLGTIAAFCLENQVNRARLTWSGLTDVLTGWHNRRYLTSRLPEEVALSARTGLPLSCLLLDVDHFKRVNDEHGHLAGDAALREVARRAQKQIRASDLAARYGGEEFVLLLPDTGEDAALQMAERLRASICASPVRAGDDASLTISVSIGVATLRKDDAEGDPRGAGERLLARADTALYAAKESGRNRVCRAD